MANYTYTARDQQGTVQNGQLDAVSEDEVISILQRRGLFVTAISLKNASASPAAVSRAPSMGGRKSHSRRMHTGVNTDDHVLLCQQMVTLVEAGVPLLKALEVVTSQVESRMLLIALEEVHRDVQGGKTLRDALARHPKIFGNLWINLVETGEASGHLAQALKQLASHYEAAQHLQNSVKTALTYPTFLICAAVGVLAFFVYWIIPKFQVMFTSMNVELPLITKIVIGISEACQKYVVLIVMAAVGIFLSIKAFFATETGQWTADTVVLKIPVFKTLFEYVQIAEFSRGLSTLLESGVPLLSGLEILERSATNKHYGRAIGVIREAVKEGKTMADPMGQTGMFPPMAVQMVLIGEEVGELARMVGRVARYYEERVHAFIERMTKLFEPIAIVFMGFLVLIIVLSVFMPIFQMAGGSGMGPK